MKRNLLLTIEYDGTNFSGWQKQAGVRTVQETLEEALSKFCGCPVQISGTSRTDAGVHALGQRATLRGDFNIPAQNLMRAVNNYLAGGMNDLIGVGDVRIVAIEEKEDDFHARFDSKGKMYRYIIRNSPDVDIFRKHYAYQVKKPLDIEKMQEAAKYIVGTHDFLAFQSATTQKRETTVRTIYSLTVKKGEGCDIIIEVAGDGFLYNMVRIMVGTLVDCGTGKKKPEDIPKILESLDRSNAGLTAPAEGLYLVEVYY